MDTVVLLHGLGRTRGSMAWAARRMRREGFRPIRIGYPSMRKPIEALADHVAARLPDPRDGRLHFLTHSLGGIVLRRLVADRRPAGLGRVVMLGPPNKGSAVAGWALRLAPVVWVMGPALVQLAKGVNLGPVEFETGIIAGNRGWTPLSPFLAGEDDGVVRVEETGLDGAADCCTVRRGHTFIMNSREALDQAVHFFRTGKFYCGQQGQRLRSISKE